MIQFLLNQTPVSVAPEDGAVTVLDYLRCKQKLCGTKEGCASGDCGACTVVVVEPKGEQLDYSAINSCITFVGALHGKQLITVEHLQDKQLLHPVQQALVDYHGSQCGFCTPGFVMSLFALYHQPGIKTRKAIEHQLGGNLCRCTGYRPIVDAALAVCDGTARDQFSDNENATRALLNAIDVQPPVSDSSQPYFIPTTAASLATLLTQMPDAQLCAGCTDLGVQINQQLHDPSTIIDIGNTAELLAINEDEDYFRIGAAVTYSQCESLLQMHYPAFAELLLRLGSRQIRNSGTLGGNIANASPIADTPPVLIALCSGLTLQSSRGIREMLLQGFFLDYKKTALASGEFIREILLPKPLPGYTLKVYKVSKRSDDDISAVLMAVWICIDKGIVNDIVIAFGGMAAIPKRAMACEAALLNQEMNTGTIHAAQMALEKDFQPIDDVRASAGYRIQVAKNLLTRLRLELCDDTVKTQVSDCG